MCHTASLNSRDDCKELVMIHSHQVPTPVRDSTSVQSSMLIARQRIGAETDGAALRLLRIWSPAWQQDL